jgi:hypothetical protein
VAFAVIDLAADKGGLAGLQFFGRGELAGDVKVTGNGGCGGQEKEQYGDGHYGEKGTHQ